MNQLINITQNNGSKVVSARELHTFLEVETKFNDWIKRMLEYGFDENEDYSLLKIGERSAHNKIDYALTLDTAKEISMLQRSERGKQARRYFIAVEKQANQPQLHASSKTLIETRQEQRDQLMLLIRKNFMQGDIKKVALANNWSYETVRNVVKRRHFNANIAQALFDQAMTNKQTQNIDILTMIDQLTL